MGSVAVYKELRSLTIEAAQVVGEHRTALIAGCSLTSVQTWLRRPQAQLMRKTIERTLPRLRHWREWIPVYEAAVAEVALIEAASLPLETLTAEFCARFTEATDRCTLTQIAYACEVSVSQLQRWAAGVVPECERAEIIRAVGHLRHSALWRDLTPANTRARMVTMATAAGTAC